MTTKPNFVFVDVPQRPKANSIAVKRQRLIEGLTKQAAEVKRFEQGHWTPRNWFWSDDSGKFYLEVRYAKKPLVISEGKSAILCQSLEDVAAKIEQLKAIVKVGGLDPQIEAASGAIRSRFKKRRG